jgi:hypothetical protein
MTVTLEDILKRARGGAERGKVLADLQRIGGSLGVDDLPMLAELGAERGYGALCGEIRKSILKRPTPRPDREAVASERRGAPRDLPPGWEDPRGWLCAWNGVFKLKDGDDGDVEEVRVTHDPIWIGQRWRDVDSGDHHLELVWPGGSETVDRGTAMQARELAGLAARGAPVSSRSARDVVAYLEAAEACNRGTMPVASSITRLGWTMAGEERAWQTAEGPHLLRADGGHLQTVAAMQPRGTWEQWRAMAMEVVALPVPALLLCASAGSAALEATGAHPFVVDLHGTTSKGKSTTLRFAASLWGDPSDTAGLLLPWSSTATAIERRAAFLKHSPMFVDDTKKCAIRDREKLAAIIYGWGVGKARGTIGGVQEVATWRSALLSTGEAPLSEIAGEHAGLRMRVLPVSAQPIPDGHAAVRLIEGMDAWGHGGPKVAEWVRLNWATLPARWEKARDKAEKDLGGQASSRLAGFVASIGIGALALHGIGVRVPWGEVEKLLLEGAQTALASSDIPSAAWERIQGWLVAVQDRVAEQEGWTRNTACLQGWIGKVLRNGSLAIHPSALEGELKRIGYDPSELIPRWAAVGRCGEKPEAVKWMGKTTRMYVLNVAEGWKQGAGGDDNLTGGSVTNPEWPHGEVPV